MTEPAPPSPRSGLRRLIIIGVIGACLAGLAFWLITSDVLPDASIKNMGGDPLYVTPTAPPILPLLPTLPPGEIAGQTYGRLQLQSEAFLDDVCAILDAHPGDYAASEAYRLRAACAAVAEGERPAYHGWSPALCDFPALLDALQYRPQSLPHYQAYVARLCAA